MSKDYAIDRLLEIIEELETLDQKREKLQDEAAKLLPIALNQAADGLDIDKVLTDRDDPLYAESP